MIQHSSEYMTLSPHNGAELLIFMYNMNQAYL
ncbi:Uncharacterized protein BM_BM725, partial [Brugia malayi]